MLSGTSAQGWAFFIRYCAHIGEDTCPSGMVEWALNGPTPHPPQHTATINSRQSTKINKGIWRVNKRICRQRGVERQRKGVYFLASALTGGWDMVTKGVWRAETPMEGRLYSGPRKQRVKPGAIREMRKWGITQKRDNLNSVFEHCTRQTWVWSTAGYLRVTPRELEGQLRVVSIQGSWWRRWGFQSQSPKDPEGQPEICIATHHRWDRACCFNLIKSTAC